MKVRLLYEGPNFRLGLAGDVVVGETWSTGTMSLADGTAIVDIQRQLLSQLAQRPLRGVIYDLTRVINTTGPRSKALIIDLMRAWGDAGKPIAIVVSSSEREEEFGTMLRGSGAVGALFRDRAAAMDWLDQLPSSPRAVPPPVEFEPPSACVEADLKTEDNVLPPLDELMDATEGDGPAHDVSSSEL